MVIGFTIGLSMASIFLPSNLALAMTTGIVCGLLAGAFYAQVSYGDVFWHIGESVASAEGVQQPSNAPKNSESNSERTRYSGTKPTAENHEVNRTKNRTGKLARKNRSTSSFSTSRFRAMITGNNARQKKYAQKEKSYWISHQRSQTFIPGRQEQQGRRYQRRVKQREGLRIES